MNFRDTIYESLNLFAPGFKAINSEQLRVLAYHDIKDPECFEHQIKYLKSNYNLISVSNLRQHLFHNVPLSPYSLLITFDDGDVSLIKKGLPLFLKYNVPACVFIVTGLINTIQDYWWNTVRIQEQKRGKNPAEVQAVIKKLKQVDNVKRIELLEEYTPTNKIQFTLDDLKQLEKHNISIANHSHTHPMFDKCTEDEISNEIEMSTQTFKEWGIGQYDVFAYPNGNFDKKSEIILKDNDIKMAFLFDHKINRKKINPLRISRIRVDSDTKIKEFKVKVSGLHSKIYKTG